MAGGGQMTERRRLPDERASITTTSVPFSFKKDSTGNRELDGRLWEQMPGEED
jgi:hypothetical protein